MLPRVPPVRRPGDENQSENQISEQELENSSDDEGEFDFRHEFEEIQ